MKKKKKHIISKEAGSIFLLTLFLTPLFIQIVHSFKHHHTHFECNAYELNENHLHGLEKACPICEYKFTPISKKTSFEKTPSVLIVSAEIKLIYISPFVHEAYFNTSYLRGPPLM